MSARCEHPAVRALCRLGESLAAPAAELRAAERSGRLRPDAGGLAASCAHMHLNRLLRSSACLQELVLFDLLERIYRSELARGREPA